ncbi:hypothetical protein D6C97_00285 [Aureobasidium pullulans]|nr:hypothetical protein D6C97_00285 [Aureobasidium pullulans]
MTMSDSEDDYPVYRVPPLDPSIYSPIYPDNADPKLVEIARSVEDLFRLWIGMRWLPEDQVHFAPHTSKPINIKEAARLGISKQVVDLYQLLPYVQEDVKTRFGHWDGGAYYLFGGVFLDLRGGDVNWLDSCVLPASDLPFITCYLGEGERPGWDDGNGGYIKPHYAVLSKCGNHNTIIVVDTKTYQLWAVDQDGEVQDPAFRCKWDDFRGSAWWDLSQYPNRPAVKFFQDMKSRHETLRYIPGGIDNPNDWEFYEYNSLYRRCGWPYAFDVSKFEDENATISHCMGQCEDLDEDWEKKEPFRNVIRLEKELERINRLNGDIELAQQAFKSLDVEAAPGSDNNLAGKLIALKRQKTPVWFKSFQETARQHAAEAKAKLEAAPLNEGEQEEKAEDEFEDDEDDSDYYSDEESPVYTDDVSDFQRQYDAILDALKDDSYEARVVRLLEAARSEIAKRQKSEEET